MSEWPGWPGLSGVWCYKWLWLSPRLACPMGMQSLPPPPPPPDVKNLCVFVIREHLSVHVRCFESVSAGTEILTSRLSPHCLLRPTSASVDLIYFLRY